ncbi:hypothetical protein OH687_10985 [Burkholderia anthina]|nr:hypothetical protein OH687_10985 [Burkholderia anthina]
MSDAIEEPGNDASSSVQLGDAATPCARFERGEMAARACAAGLLEGIQA